MKIETKYITPFLESVENLFITMMGISVKPEKISLANKPVFLDDDITVLMALSSNVQTTVMTLTFGRSAAAKVVSKLLEEEILPNNLDVITDGLGEIANMIGGGAKAKFSGDGPPVDLSLPQIILGAKDKILFSTSKAQWIDIPFVSSIGKFSIRITTNKNGAEK